MADPIARLKGTPPMTAWLAGLVVGVAGGLLSLEAPLFGWPVLMAFAIGASRSRLRTAGLAGLLLGLVAAVTALIGRVAITCPSPDCQASGIETWLAAGLGTLAFGTLLTALAATRHDRPR
jgi:hypothetical protein